MRRVFGGSVHKVAIAWRAGELSADVAMDRIYRLLPVGEREEYVEIKYDADRAEIERGILARRAADIVSGKGIVL